MEQFTNALISGIPLGAVYGLLALPVALLMRATRIFNIAQANISVLGILLAVEFGHRSNFGLLLAGILAVILGAIIGGATHTFAIRPLRRRSEELYTPLVATLAVSIILEVLMLLRYGDVPVELSREPIAGIIHITGITTISFYELVLITLALVVGVVSEIWIRRTDIGLKWRAMGEEPLLASLRGISLRRSELLLFILAGAASGLVGVFISTEVPVIYSSGISLALTVFLVLGFMGTSNLVLIPVGGLALGCVQQLLTAYTSSSVMQLGEVGLLIVWLLVFPTGGLAKAVLRDV